MHASVLLICLSGSYTVVALGADEVRESRGAAQGYNTFDLCGGIGFRCRVQR